MSDLQDFLKRNLYGKVAKKVEKKEGNANKAIVTSKIGKIKHGKKVVYVTPFLNSAKEEEKKWQEKGLRTEIKKEKDDNDRIVFVVYVFE